MSSLRAWRECSDSGLYFPIKRLIKMNSLNKIQKKILTIGVVVILICCLFPPWVHTFKAKSIYSEESAGYAPIISPPSKKQNSVGFGVKLDISRLLLQIFIIFIATGAGALLVSKNI